MNEMIIREAILEDVPSLALLCNSTFYETYADFNTDSDMLHYTRMNFSHTKLEEEINDPDTTIYVCESDGLLIGYTVTRVLRENKSEILRLYVLKDFKRRGIGKNLMDAAVEKSKKSNAKDLFLHVWKENEGAISFYKKYGFEITGETVFDWGTGKKDNDWVMSLSV